MPVSTTERDSVADNPPLSRPLLAFGAFFAVMVAATLALWAYFGTSVFFEMIRAGFIACF